MKPSRRPLLISAFILIAATLFLFSTVLSEQGPQAWEVRLARNAQANSAITIRNQCQQTHSFNVSVQQAPFLQLLQPGAITVPGRSTYECPVRFNTNGMNAGDYRANVVVKCEDCQKEKTCAQDVEVLQLHLSIQADQPSPTATPTATPQSTPTKSGSEAPPVASPSPSPCAPTQTPTTYSVKDLLVLPTIDGSPPNCMATGINDAGNVVGVCFGKYTGGASRAFRTDAGGAAIKAVDDLGLPAGVKGGYSFATAVNAAGHVVGYWSGGGDKAFWHDASKASKMISLHPPAFMTSKAFAINVHDDVVGAAYALKFGPVSFGLTFDGHAVIWPHVDAAPAAMTDLNDGLAADIKKDWILRAAFAIADDGDVVGRAYNKKTGKYHAFLLKGVGGKFVDLGALKEDVFDSSAAYALDACHSTMPEIDEVVGYTFTDSKTYPGKSFHYGATWIDGIGPADMETLPPYSSKPEPLESFAQAINSKTEVVGAMSFSFHLSQTFEYAVLGPGPALVGDSCVPNSHAIWYNGKELKDLNKLIPASSGWELNLANGINEKGWIAGSGFYKCSTAAALASSKLSKAVLLVPFGPSSSSSLPGSGAAKCPLSLPSGGYIFDNWNVCGVMNTPTKDTSFTIDAPYLVTFIATYHWNYGGGALPGGKGISLKDASGKIFGPWAVTTSAGSGGAANVNWECHPGVTLPAGTYTVIDPDPATWSQNTGTGGSGFVRVAGTKK